MSEVHQNCILIFYPPAYERLDKVRDGLELAGYDVRMVQYGNAADEVKNDLWGWLAEECPDNPVAVVWPGVDFYDPWVADYIKNANDGIHNVIAKLVKQGAVEVRAQYDWGGAWDDTVTMYDPPEEFVLRICNSIEHLAAVGKALSKGGSVNAGLNADRYW